MNFEPQKFFVGLMDFFSVLMPGGVLTYLIKDDVGAFVLGSKPFIDIKGPEAVAVFLVVSYLLGHLLFLVGSWLDEIPYNWLRRHYTVNQLVKRMAMRGTLPPSWLRAVAWTIFKRERNLAVRSAGQIKEHVLAPLKAVGAVSTFQWSRALLAKEHPESLATVHRFEADSKFFRSFFVVLVVFAIYSGVKGRADLAASALALTLPTLWRFMDQRYKATNQAYWSVITLTAREGKAYPQTKEATKTVSTDPTHAGGIVFRIRNGQAEYLLVEAKRDPKQWVLPKGHIEESEHPRETAVREVHEETGVWARIVGDLSNRSYSANGNVVTVRYFLMQAVGHGLRQDKDRQHEWLTLQDAIGRANYIETRELLQEAFATCSRLQMAEKRRVRR